MTRTSKAGAAAVNGGARRFRRRTLRVRVRLVWADGSLESWATTLGAGGMYVPTEAPLATGTDLVAHFSLNDSGADHAIQSQVAWSVRDPKGTPGMGLTFHDQVARARLARELGRLDDDPDEGN